MTTDRLLQVIDVMRDTSAPSGDDVMAYWVRGWNNALEALAKQVRLEDALMAGVERRERAAALADFADAVMPVEA